MKNLVIILLVSLVSFGCKTNEARKPLSTKSGSYIKESAKLNKKLVEQERATIEAFISQQSDKQFIASENGFWYSYDTKVEQDTIKADFGDTINFDYNLKHLNGETIYSKASIGNRDYVMEKEILFTGLREGLKLMKPGEDVTFVFPSYTAYGYYGDDKKIGTNVPLISEVTLNSITQNNND
ncbi:gliding motility-associated peptidyl-prolyl isomerase GldI [Winogradskyella maritima]|uniref:Peptidyl-prolyl cis-trans isomerase n=1 Tax=Winogradskyella maritima TaxID=1517766 RepID=A0ABV8AGY5_9FLAO|nr:gliding motility-associated peptidyl-prolyl isomerase GldI [Winogradskyella maritima]